MSMINGRVDAGKIKVWLEIARYYYGIIFQIITGFGMLKLLGVSWLVNIIIFLCMIPVFMLIVYFHMKYVYPLEVKYTWEKNPAYKQLLKNTENNND